MGGRALDVPLERRHRVGLHAVRGIVDDDETLGLGIRRSGVERAESPPDAATAPGDLAEILERDEITGAQIDRRIGPCGRRRPRRLEELTVRVTERGRPRERALGVDQGDRAPAGR